MRLKPLHHVYCRFLSCTLVALPFEEPLPFGFGYAAFGRKFLRGFLSSWPSMLFLYSPRTHEQATSLLISVSLAATGHNKASQKQIHNHSSDYGHTTGGTIAESGVAMSTVERSPEIYLAALPLSLVREQVGAT